MRAHLKHGQNVGMVQRGRRSRLLLEAPQAVRIGGKEGWQHLDRDITSQSRIAGSIDLPHSASTDFRDDSVLLDRPADRLFAAVAAFSTKILGQTTGRNL